MESIKTSSNVKFDVIYADGTRHRVHEGILFEVDDESIIFHNGTNRKSVLFATVETLFKVINMLDAVGELEAYLAQRVSETVIDAHE